MEIQGVPDLIEDDHWTVIEGETRSGPFVLRYREPVLQPPQTAGYSRCISVLWPYADEGDGQLPSPGDSEEMQVFEDRISEAFEHDARAVLTAVLTFDGARQWVFYTDDVAECGCRA